MGPTALSDRSRTATVRAPCLARRAARGAGPAVAALGLLLAACAGDEQSSEVFCPRPVAVQDAANLVRFSGAGRDLTDVEFEARLEDLAMACTYDDDENVIDGTLRVALFASRGPANSERQARIDYFVAIATANREVIAREEFEVVIPFEGNRTQMTAVEELRPRIPLHPGETGEEYTVFVGLALSPGELEYNRANR